MNKETEQRLIAIADEIYKIAIDNGVMIQIDTGKRYNFKLNHKNIGIYSSTDNSKVYEKFNFFPIEEE